MNHVLVAVDGSAASLKGARKALELAKPFGAKVTFIYVVAPMIMPGDAPWAPVDEIHEAEIRRGTHVLADAVKELGAVDIDTTVRVGPPAETITDTAAQLNADVVVVGSTGKGAVKRLLVGSTTDRLVHICARPVLIIH